MVYQNKIVLSLRLWSDGSFFFFEHFRKFGVTYQTVVYVKGTSESWAYDTNIRLASKLVQLGIKVIRQISVNIKEGGHF